MTAKRTSNILLQKNKLVATGEGINDLDPAGEGFAKTEDMLDRLGGLPGTDNAAEGAENASLGTIGNGPWFGWMRKKTAVTRGTGGWIKDAHLSLKLENTAVDERGSGQPGGIVNEITAGKIIRSVNNKVKLADDLLRIFRTDAVGKNFCIQIRVEAEKVFAGAFHFRVTPGRLGVEDLAMKVTGLDTVMVGQTKGPDAGGGEVEAGRTPKTPHSNDKDAAAGKPGLPRFPHAGEDGLAAVAVITRSFLTHGDSLGELFSGPQCPDTFENAYLALPFLVQRPCLLSMSKERYVVIMAGGKGERFWPQSRLSRPKHLLPIVGETPMLTQTVERLGSVVPPENVLIITNAEQREAVIEVCPTVPAGNVIAEPVGRDTAAAVGLSTLLVEHRNPEATFAMLPADHVIHDEAGFQSILATAFTAAEEEEALVTIGIRAEYPATGYGYIERGAETAQVDGRPVFEVSAFKEKPDEATARAYVESGNYDWNAGMFFWRVPVISREFASHTPDLWKALGAIREGLGEGKSLDDLLAKHYPSLEKISIDYAIMEKAAKVRVVESAFDWDDVGEWPAVERHYEKDAGGNVQRGDAVIEDGKGNIVMSGNGHTTALIGVKDLIVVHTEDATLVCPKDRAQDIKKLVRRLGEDGRHGDLL